MAAAGLTGECRAPSRGVARMALSAAHGHMPLRCHQQEFAAKMCPLGGRAAPMLIEALDAGAKQAQLAVAALKSYGACIDDQARVDAMASLVDSPQLINRTLVMK